MSKRKALDVHLDLEPAKRSRHESPSDRLSALSHELILRVLSYLPVEELIVCHRVSRTFKSLAADSQLWKALYYNRFVRPRASKIPGIQDSGVPADSLHFSSKLSRWLDEESLVRRGEETNWKRQYKLRHNWSRGSCAVSEIPVAEQPSIPPMLVQMHDNTIYMADHTEGLRAWNSRAGRDMLAKTTFREGSAQASPPTALSVDIAATSDDHYRTAIGFEDGSYSIYRLDVVQAKFQTQYSHAASSNGMISAIAMSFPYLATMTANQLLSVYKFKEQDLGARSLDPPQLLHSLRSHTVWPPLSLTIRPLTDSILVSIAYALPTYLSGWTVGIQEMLMTASGDLIESRTASAIDQHFRPLITPQRAPTATDAYTRTFAEAKCSKPTSLSYTHPYLLVSHPDNTLTLYLVSTTSSSLSISPGRRLWGHTSSVVGAHVGGRGKAVSVTSRGDELRVWELEGTSRRRQTADSLSVRLRPENQSTQLVTDPPMSAPRSAIALAQKPVSIDVKSNVEWPSQAVAPMRTGLGFARAQNDINDDTSMIRGWIGFDDENVVVLKEKGSGGQALVVYDFA